MSDWLAPEKETDNIQFRPRLQLQLQLQNCTRFPQAGMMFVRGLKDGWMYTYYYYRIVCQAGHASADLSRQTNPLVRTSSWRLMDALNGKHAMARPGNIIESRHCHH